MDAMNTEAAAEEVVITPRATLASIIEQCERALNDRLAKRFSTRDALKDLKVRARALLGQEEEREWDEEFEKVVTTANAVFDQLIAEVEPAGHA